MQQGFKESGVSIPHSSALQKIHQPSPAIHICYFCHQPLCENKYHANRMIGSPGSDCKCMIFCTDKQPYRLILFRHSFIRQPSGAVIGGELHDVFSGNRNTDPTTSLLIPFPKVTSSIES
jgi:hypothetical protein